MKKLRWPKVACFHCMRRLATWCAFGSYMCASCKEATDKRLGEYGPLEKGRKVIEI